MPGSLVSVFGDPDDYRTALGAEGIVELLPTESGQFQARLTEIALNRLRLAAGEERLARIAFVAVPAGRVMLVLMHGRGPAAIWSGVQPRAGDIVTIGPGERVHWLTRGPIRWASLQLAAADLAAYASSLTGNPFPILGGVARWRPTPAAGRQLLDLHRAAIRASERHSAPLADGEAVHGLEQQLIQAVIDGLLSAIAERETPGDRQHREILARFEDLLAGGSSRSFAVTGAALGVSERLLRQCCAAHLAMGPSDYRRRRALQRAHRALRCADPNTARVAAIASSCGFRDLGRFACRYRAIYGESPSQTLRRGPHMNLR